MSILDLGTSRTILNLPCPWKIRLKTSPGQKKTLEPSLGRKKTLEPSYQEEPSRTFLVPGRTSRYFVPEAHPQPFLYQKNHLEPSPY